MVVKAVEDNTTQHHHTPAFLAVPRTLNGAQQICFALEVVRAVMVAVELLLELVVLVEL
jgi:hypothetical protein